MSSQADRGKDLEAACIFGSREYERRDVASVFHRPTKKIWDRRRQCWVYPEHAGVDFNGHSRGTAVTFDAKETHRPSWPISDVTESQKDTLRANRAGISGLVIAFMPFRQHEVYWVSIDAFDAFLREKWRESLSRDWCRAFGECCKIEATAARQIRVMFLDRYPHPERDAAAVVVATEKAAAVNHAAQKSLELPKGDLPKPEKPLTGRGSPFDLLEVARAARRRGVVGKKWGDRR